ncbi:gamma carbonic anhydrase family protein [Salibacterium salarium]|uniref:Gamma carbonic anhydrase family protein n=1 Tax=Salibacterium salarium TaxID=284579 RepID=A0A428N6D8_9BACI|nr:gamma carbonic anhydrase family protein [Salibacterium salarium]RSL34030.1 gamma carbonic anhydrase family protein [Salibacterium salarium]
MNYTLKGKTPRIHESSYIAPGSQLIGNIELKKDSSVWFNAILRGDNEEIAVSECSNVQDGAVVHVDPGFPVYIGKNVTVGHNAIIHGCTIEDNALIGMGATVLNGATIGEGALVAAGALVSEGKVVKPGTLVAGVPAKEIRKLSENNLKRSKDGANHYVENARLYKSEEVF